MSFFYKPIDIDNLEYIRKELYESYPSYETGTKLFYPKEKLAYFLKVPAAVELFQCFKISKFLIPELGCSFVRINSKSKIPLHTDTKFRYSFNIPLVDCSGSILNFYSTEVPGTISKTPNGVSYTSYDTNNCNLELSTAITCPFVMDTKMIHGVTNDSAQDSILLLIRLSHAIDEVIEEYF